MGLFDFIVKPLGQFAITALPTIRQVSSLIGSAGGFPDFAGNLEATVAAVAPKVIRAQPVPAPSTGVV